MLVGLTGELVAYKESIEDSYISQLQEVKEREDHEEQEINNSDSCECQVFLGNNLLNELQVVSMCVRVCVSVVIADAAAVVLVVIVVVVALHLKCGLCDCVAATTINNIINSQEHKVLRKFLSYSQPAPASE